MIKCDPMPCLLLNQDDIEGAIIEKIERDTKLSSVEVTLHAINGRICAMVVSSQDGGEHSLIAPYSKGGR